MLLSLIFDMNFRCMFFIFCSLMSLLSPTPYFLFFIDGPNSRLCCRRTHGPVVREERLLEEREDLGSIPVHS